MPELPEVETVRTGLAPTLDGARLERIEARRPDLRFPLPPDFAHRLTGARVLSLQRRAKYLLAPLDSGETLIMHLGMTGRFEIERGEGSGEIGGAPGAFHYPAPVGGKHAHVVLETDAGARVIYSDARRFGFMDLVRSDALSAYPAFAAMGPEPLGPDFTAEALVQALAGRRQAIKLLLLDQRVVAGLGNIYVCEALHRARLSPFTPGGEAPLKRLKPLVAAIKAVLEEAIAAGGSTLRDYVAADGSLGYFQHSFRCYGREDQPCLRDGCAGAIARAAQGGRSTFHCTVCQV
ncbi:MAG TPA: bifunctional DNA-formamidopyrimidine glycosylase/DNA-(apurinic or apyrimidinic site) lyase [Caulobacteraceae bacterium]|nr:bifunctional DNA-formamidopyrimidine glycosylase/DNA-(apurinic or apyrimidinic site) lyase [Caulobacteraceae bacterium]